MQLRAFQAEAREALGFLCAADRSRRAHAVRPSYTPSAVHMQWTNTCGDYHTGALLKAQPRANILLLTLNEPGVSVFRFREPVAVSPSQLVRPCKSVENVLPVSFPHDIQPRLRRGWRLRRGSTCWSASGGASGGASPATAAYGQVCASRNRYGIFSAPSALRGLTECDIRQVHAGIMRPNSSARSILSALRHTEPHH